MGGLSARRTRRQEESTTAVQGGLWGSQEFSKLAESGSVSGERVQVVDDGVSEACRAGHEDALVDPQVVGHARLELYDDTEVVFSRVDLLAPGKPSEDLGRAMANTARGDVDEGVIVRLQRVACVYAGHTVGVDDLPVGAPGKHLAAQVRSLETTADDGDDASLPRWALPEGHGRAKLDQEPAESVESQEGDVHTRHVDTSRRLRVGLQSQHEPDRTTNRSATHNGKSTRRRGRCGSVADMEADYAYKGTDTVRPLIVGRDIAGKNAFV